MRGEAELRSVLRRELHLIENEGQHVLYGRLSGVLLPLDGRETSFLRAFLEGLGIEDACSECGCSPVLGNSVLARIVDELASRRISTQTELPGVTGLLLIVAEACNMACSYCYGRYYEREIPDRLMSEETARRAIEFACDIEAQEVAFFGGEPLLNMQAIRAAVERSRELGSPLRFGVTTNGTLVTDDVADYLQDQGIRASVSIDGPQAVHDLTRRYRNGAATYRDVTRGIDRLRSRRILDCLEVTHSMRHPEDLKTIVDAVAKLHNCVTCTCVEGPDDVSYADEVVRGDRLTRFYNDMLDLLVRASEQDQSVYFGGIVELIQELAGSVRSIGTYVCDGLTRRAAVGVNGDVFPCPETMTEEFRFGNVWDDSLASHFDDSRLNALAPLHRDKAAEHWFSNMVDACVVRYLRQPDGTLRLVDAPSIGASLERFLARVARLDLPRLASTGQEALHALARDS